MALGLAAYSATTFTSNAAAQATVTSPSFSPAAGDVLYCVGFVDNNLAQITENAPTNTGTALSWALVKRENTFAASSIEGSLFVWWAYNAADQSGITVTVNSPVSTAQLKGVAVIGFTGADRLQTGAVSVATEYTAANTTPASSPLTTSKAGSWIWMAGWDWTGFRSTMAPAAGQSAQIAAMDASSAGDTEWLQKENPQPGDGRASGTSVTMSDTGSTASDFIHLVAWEIIPAPAVAGGALVRPGQTWLRRFRSPQYSNQFYMLPGAPTTSANAGLASATASVPLDTTLSIAPLLAVRAAPGPAWVQHFHHPQEPVSLPVFVTALAQVAPGSAAALDATVNVSRPQPQPYAVPGQTWRRQFLSRQVQSPGLIGTLALAWPARGYAGGSPAHSAVPELIGPGAAIPGRPATPVGAPAGTTVNIVQGVWRAPAKPGPAWLRHFQHPQPPIVPDLGVHAIPALGTATANFDPSGTSASIDCIADSPVGAVATAFDVTTAVPAPPPQYASPGRPWRGHFQHVQQPIPALPAPSVTASAGLASASVIALGVDTAANIASVAPNAGNAAATGTALGQDTGANVASVTVNAGLASATGTVPADTGLSITYPPSQAYPSPLWRERFQHAQAPLPPASVAITAALASASGTSLGADTGANIAFVSPAAGNAASTGAALGQDSGANLTAVTVNAGLASAVGTAGDVTQQLPAAPLPQAYPGAAWRKYFQHPQQPLPVAPPAAVSVSAGLATATGTALGATVIIAPAPATAAATGTALGQDTGANIASVAPAPATSAATGTALGPLVALTVGPATALASAAALDALTQLLSVAPQQQARPGAVWREHFQHRYVLAPFVPAPPPALIPATSTATVADVREGTMTPAFSTRASSSSGAADVREGAASVS